MTTATDAHGRGGAGRAALRQDIEDAVAIARAGQAAPLLGGPIGLAWTGLAAVALLVHGATLAGWLPIPLPMVGLVWLIYGVVGTLLSVALGRRIDGQPGARSVANRVADAAWAGAGILIATVAVSAVYAFSALGAPYEVFGFIIVFAFGAASAINGLLARLTGHGYLRFASVAAGVAASVSLLMVSQPSLYFVAGVMVVVSGVVPSVIEMSKAKPATRAHG